MGHGVSRDGEILAYGNDIADLGRQSNDFAAAPEVALGAGGADN
jgi:hypothetical protein